MFPARSRPFIYGRFGGRRSLWDCVARLKKESNKFSRVSTNEKGCSKAYVQHRINRVAEMKTMFSFPKPPSAEANAFSMTVFADVHVLRCFCCCVNISFYSFPMECLPWQHQPSPPLVSAPVKRTQVATLAVYSIPQIISWTLCVTVIRCLWLAASGVACFGSVLALVNAEFDGSSHRPDYCGNMWAMAAWSWDCWVSIIPDYGNVSATAFLLVFWTVSVSWTSAIAESVVAATVANLVSSRLSLPDNEDTAWRSCNRVLRSSFG